MNDIERELHDAILQTIRNNIKQETTARPNYRKYDTCVMLHVTIPAFHHILDTPNNNTSDSNLQPHEEYLGQLQFQQHQIDSDSNLQPHEEYLGQLQFQQHQIDIHLSIHLSSNYYRTASPVHTAFPYSDPELIPKLTALIQSHINSIIKKDEPQQISE